MKRILLSFAALFLLSGITASIAPIFFVTPVFAACSEQDILDGVPCSDTGFTAPDQNLVSSDINESDFRVQVLKIVNYFLTFLGLFAVIAIIYAGVLMVADGGDEENAGKAKKIIMWAAIGIIIILVSFSFVNWVLNSGKNIDGASTDATGTQFEEMNPGINADNLREWQAKYEDTLLNEIDNVLRNIGNLEQDTSDLLQRILSGSLSQAEIEQMIAVLNDEQKFWLKDALEKNMAMPELQQKQIEDVLLKFFPASEVRKLTDLLTTGKRVEQQDMDVLRQALRSQGISATVADSILQKIINGETLTATEVDLMTTSLKYGFMLERLSTELKVLYDSMPKTAVNVAAYNDVITALTSVKADPANSQKAKIVERVFAELKALVIATPKVIARIQATPSSGASPLLVSLDASDSIDPNEITIPHQNFTWSYYDSLGVEQIMGTGPVIDYLFEEPGLYVVSVRVETALKENDYKTAMDGVAKVKIKVEPKTTDIQVFIDGHEVNAVRKVHISDAKKGISFDSSRSISQKGRKIVEYRWNFGDGTQEVSENGEAITHRFTTVGTYIIKLEVEDNTGSVTRKNFKLVVEHLTAEIDVLPKFGTTRSYFKLSATDSKSSDFLISEYLWAIYNDTGEIVFSSDEDEVNFHTEQAGDYSVKLTITDAEGNTESSDYNLEIHSLTPTANFVMRELSRASPATWVFDASSSADPEKDPLLYSWDFNGDGVFEIENTQEARVTYSFEKTGSFKTLLKVTDTFQESDDFTRQVKVNSLLNVDFAISSIAAQKNQEIQFQASSKYAKAYYWDFGDGTRKSSETPDINYSFSESGNYQVELTVFDENDNENSIVKRMFIGDALHPVAAFEVDVDGEKRFPELDICGEELGMIVSRRDTIKFSGVASVNIDGRPQMLDYTWDFGDGDFGNTKVATHRYSEISATDECFLAKLTVKDRVTGKTGVTQNFGVKVENLAPVLQTLRFELHDDESAERVTPYTVLLRAKGAQDLDGSIKQYRWWYRSLSDDVSVKRGLLKTQNSYTDIVIVSDGLSGLDNDYVFVVEMTDNEGAVSHSEELVGQSAILNVKNGNNESPDVQFTMDKNQIYTGDTISFLADASDPQGKKLDNAKYEWDFDGDGVFDDSSSGKQVAQQFNMPGEYSVRLRVTFQGLSTSVRQTIFVDKISQYPLAAFTYKLEGFELSVDAANSKFDPNIVNNSLQFSWDFNKFVDTNGDGDAKNDSDDIAQKSHFIYGKPGTYFVNLKVIDSLGVEDTVEQRVVILDPKSTQISDFDTDVLKKHTLTLTSNDTPITTLAITASKKRPNINDQIVLQARVKNADGSMYEEFVEFIVEKGDVTLSSDYVQAENGVATTNMIMNQSGEVIIKVIAKHTFYSTLEETIYLQVE